MRERISKTILRHAILNSVLVLLMWSLFLAPDAHLAQDLVGLTRSDCLQFRPWLVWTYAIADGVTALALFGMCYTYLRLGYKSDSQLSAPHSISRWVMSWQAALVLVLGVHFVIDLLLLKYSLYEAQAYVKALLACVSTISALWVVRRVRAVVMVPRGLLQQAVDDLHALVNTPASNVQEFRSIMEQGLTILDSIVDTKYAAPPERRQSGK